MGCGSSKAVKQVESPEKNKKDEPSQHGPRASADGSKRSGRLTTPRVSDLREAAEKPLTIFVIGGPGSGKGTQCQKIVEKYGGGCRHLSTGDLLRAEVEKGTELGKQIETTMKSGALVSDDQHRLERRAKQVIALLEKEISASAWFGLAFLVDGFPRTVPQANKFDASIRPADLVLYFECPEKVMLERLGERGKSSGRKDDNPTTVKERLKTFQKQSLPVVKFYEDQQKLRRISAVPPPDEVFKEVAAILDEKFDMKPESLPVAAADGRDWRPKQVVEIENRFYGSRE